MMDSGIKYGSSSFNMNSLNSELDKKKSQNFKSRKQFLIEGSVVDKGNIAEKAVKLQIRLASYKNWTSKKSKYVLATAGFRYTGEGDRVECDDCLKRVYKWSKEDDPLETHFRIAPDCPFIKDIGYSLDHQIPKYMRYSNYRNRLESMAMVPEQFRRDLPSFESLAKSGFFYQGTLDRMCCFHCGLVLRDWEKDTDANEVHEQFQKNCLFITNLSEQIRNGVGVELKLKNENKGNNTKSSNTTHKKKSGSSTPRMTCRMAGLPDQFKHTSFLMTDQIEREKCDSRSQNPKQPTEFIRYRPIGRFAKLTGQDVVDGGHQPKRPDQLTTQQQSQRSDIANSGSQLNPVVSPIEEAVLEMGYSIQLIQQAKLERSANGEGEFPDATSLCLAVMDLADRLKQ